MIFSNAAVISWTVAINGRLCIVEPDEDSVGSCIVSSVGAAVWVLSATSCEARISSASSVTAILPID